MTIILKKYYISIIIKNIYISSSDFSKHLLRPYLQYYFFKFLKDNNKTCSIHSMIEYKNKTTQQEPNDDKDVNSNLANNKVKVDIEPEKDDKNHYISLFVYILHLVVVCRNGNEHVIIGKY